MAVRYKCSFLQKTNNTIDLNSLGSGFIKKLDDLYSSLDYLDNKGWANTKGLSRKAALEFGIRYLNYHHRYERRTTYNKKDARVIIDKINDHFFGSKNSPVQSKNYTESLETFKNELLKNAINLKTRGAGFEIATEAFGVSLYKTAEINRLISANNLAEYIEKNITPYTYELSILMEELKETEDSSEIALSKIIISNENFESRIKLSSYGREVIDYITLKLSTKSNLVTNINFNEKVVNYSKGDIIADTAVFINPMDYSDEFYSLIVEHLNTHQKQIEKKLERIHKKSGKKITHLYIEESSKKLEYRIDELIDTATIDLYIDNDKTNSLDIFSMLNAVIADL